MIKKLFWPSEAIVFRAALCYTYKKCSSELFFIIFSGAGALSGPVFRSISNILQNSPLFHSGIRLLTNDTALSDLLGRACLLFHGAMLLFTVHAGSLIGEKEHEKEIKGYDKEEMV